jgi:hypothetical protein
MADRTLWVRGGVAGVVSVVCYVLAITLPWPETRIGTTASLLVVSAWPILSVVYSYALYHFIAAERDSAVNSLGFVFAVAGFATVLAMIVVQLAVGAGMAEITAGLDEETARALRRGLRLVDHGLDVAWDFLIGMALSGFGPVWASISALLGAALIALNAATFPWPPADRGLVDIGPLIGVFVIVLASRLTVLGRRTGQGA